KNLKLIDPAVEASYRRSRIVGDEILIACVGSIGKIALVNEKLKGFNIVRAVARVPANYALINRLFLATYLSMPFVQDFFQIETRTVSQPTLNITQIEETPILLPPLPQQEQFATVVRRVESLRARAWESARQGEGLFQSLLHEAFRG
ncbi:MAG: restriction endonuclease subunit S, partial [Anaerolineales bacterium]|nr:restriction endonuclease subunit S [Anaerolineales bacterium]